MLLKLEPAFKDYLWGGNRLETDFGMHSGLSKTAEAWVLSCHKDGNSTVANGIYRGKTLLEAIKAEGKAVLGTKAEGTEDFPILIKFIDAKQNLSVQVHPDDAYAKAYENSLGKTECWYILDCDPDAELIYGLKKEVSQEELTEAIENDTLLEIANSVKVHQGDMFFIPAGTLHAIGKGILVAEIQQSSNVTYRVYDYGRLGADGKPRQLHKQQAADVILRKPSKETGKPMGKAEAFDGYQKQLLTECPLFKVERVKVDTAYTGKANADSFVSVLIVSGEGHIENGGETLSFKKGDSFFLSADSGAFKVTGNVEFLETRL